MKIKKKIFVCILSFLLMTGLISVPVFAGIPISGIAAGTGTWGVDIDLNATGIIIEGTYTKTVNHQGLIAGGIFTGTINSQPGADFGLKLDISNLSTSNLSYTGAEEYTKNTSTYSTTYSNGILSTCESINYLVMPVGTDYSFKLSPGSGYYLPDTITITKNNVALTAGTDYTYDSTTGEVRINAGQINYPMVLTANASDHQHIYNKEDTSDTYKAADATCDTAAAYYYSCTCGKAGTETFYDGEPLGHDWGEPNWQWTNDGTAAAVTFTCQRDNTHTQSPSVTIESTTTDPDCTKDGQTLYTASAILDGTTYTSTNTVKINMLGHTGGTATCHSQKICERCLTGYGELNPENHEGETEIRNRTEASCTEKGYSGDTYCLGCDTKIADGTEIDVLGHDSETVAAKAATCTEVGNTPYWHCITCDKYFSNEECTEEITQEDTLIPATGHREIEAISAKEATCTGTGNTPYWHCKTCDKYFSNKACTEVITKEDTLIPATGHGKTEITGAKEASCTAEGYTGDKICTVCKEVIEKGTVIKKKAHTYKEGKCTVCGTVDPNYKSSDSKKQSATTVTGSSVDSNKTNNSNTNSPQTGDNTQVVLWAALMAGAIFVIAGSIIVYKKKQ